jgi:hypothetical protein
MKKYFLIAMMLLAFIAGAVVTIILVIQMELAEIG